MAHREIKPLGLKMMVTPKWLGRKLTQEPVSRRNMCDKSDHLILVLRCPAPGKGPFNTLKQYALVAMTSSPRPIMRSSSRSAVCKRGKLPLTGKGNHSRAPINKLIQQD
jgi:hypothetical protein